MPAAVRSGQDQPDGGKTCENCKHLPKGLKQEQMKGVDANELKHKSM